MSIRFHKGPSIVTLFHDPSSSTSKQVLQLLSSYNANQSRADNPHHPTPSSSRTGSHGESCVVEANGAGADADSFLRQAASDPPTSPVIQLEVVDRMANPPTADQMRSIVDYLVADSSPSAEGTPKETKYTSTGFDLKEHERRKMALKKHLDSNGEAKSGMPKIKDGPLVVNWDQGSAATSLDGVKEMLDRLQREQSELKGKDTGGACVIC